MAQRYIFRLLSVILLLFAGEVSFAQEKGRSREDFMASLVGQVDRLMHVDSVFNPGNYKERDSMWQETKRLGYPDSLFVEVIHNTGYEAVMRGLHVEVAKLFTDAVNYVQGSSDPQKTKYLIRLQIGLGAIYEEMGLWTKAMNLYLDVVKMSRELPDDDREGYGDVMNNIGNIYFKQGYYAKAKDFYDSAVVFNRELGRTKDLINNYNNLAALNYVQGNHKQALSYLNQALAQVDMDKEADLYYLILQNMAVIYNRQGKKNLAIDFVKQAIGFQIEEHRNLDLIQAYLLLASFLSETEADSAKWYMDEALSISRQLQNNAAEISSLSALYSWYKYHGRYKDALEILEQTTQLQDSLANLDNRMRIESIEATYQIEQESQAKDLALQQMEIERLQSQKQEIVLIALSFCLVIAFAVMYYRYRLQKKLKRESDELAFQKQALYEKEKEMMAQREKELRDSLELKNKELTSKVLHLVRNNEFIADINRELQQLLLELNPKDTAKKEHIREMLVKLRAQGNEGTYEEFKYYFEQVHQSFYENLQKAYPSLTYKDVRLCSFLKLGLSSKEIASITFKEVRSVESARNRLRKKMELDAEVNLIDFFSKF